MLWPFTTSIKCLPRQDIDLVTDTRTLAGDVNSVGLVPKI